MQGGCDVKKIRLWVRKGITHSHISCWGIIEVCRSCKATDDRGANVVGIMERLCGPRPSLTPLNSCGDCTDLRDRLIQDIFLVLRYREEVRVRCHKKLGKFLQLTPGGRNLSQQLKGNGMRYTFAQHLTEKGTYNCHHVFAPRETC